jgi:hypothetical protein
VTAVQIEAGFQALITMAHEHGVKVYFGTIIPPFDDWPGAAEGGYVAIWQESTPGSGAAARPTG